MLKHLIALLTAAVFASLAAPALADTGLQSLDTAYDLVAVDLAPAGTQMPADAQSHRGEPSIDTARAHFDPGDLCPALQGGGVGVSAGKRLVALRLKEPGGDTG